MEAAAISIANNALNSVVKTATTAITNEIGLLLGVQEELFFIKEELDMMQAFLETASTEKVKGVVVNRWIKQVQELAFDVEDCLQEASVHMMKKSCLPFMFSVKKRDDIVRKIRVLKTRIEDVSQRNLRYNLINKDNDCHTYDESASSISKANVGLLVGLDEPKRKLVELITMEHGEVISVVGMSGLGKTTLARELYGCQELRAMFERFAWVTVQHPFCKEEFRESLAKQIPANPDDDQLELLPKKKIKEKVTEYLKDKKYLIVLDDMSHVSEWDKIKNVLPKGNERRIIVTTRSRPLAESISQTSDDIYEVNKLSEEDAFDLFYKAVYKTPNYTLVIDDDNESKDDLPDLSKYNMRYGPGSTEIMEEDCEEQKQCKQIPITKDMVTQADLIIKSCGQLPLAIVTIGSDLATKPKTSAEWKKMHDQLRSELANNRNLGVIKVVLTSSYDSMPYHLKPCLLYLSVFHNNKDIRRSRIIRRWMADGYLTAEEIGKNYFNDLMGRSLIQPSQMSTIVNGEVKSCNIHDLMYELILAKAVDESMVSVLEDENLTTRTEKVRHLVIAGEQCIGDKVLERVKLSHMRSLSIFGEVGDYLSHYPRMKLVRVLDLEGSINLNDGDLRSIGKLRHLKYLGLRGTKITKLPNSLGKLSELETLDIRNTGVLLLPTGLTKLPKLRYLCAGSNDYFEHPRPTNDYLNHIVDIIMIWLAKVVDKCMPTIDNTADAVSDGVRFLCILCCFIPILPCFCLEKFEEYKVDRYSKGVRVPRGIGKLRSLNIFGMIDIGGSNSLAKEMQNLTNLRKLAVTGFTKENGKTLAEVIDGLKHLRSLFLSAADESGLRCCLDYVSSPPKYLQSLKLYSHLGELPDWISSLENLEKIHFRRTELTGGIKAIEKLPNLNILYLLRDSFKDLKELCFGEGTFPMLQVMILQKIFELELVTIEKTALKRLEQLKIRKCRSIGQDGVSGLDFLVQLKEIEVVPSDSESNKTFLVQPNEMQEKLRMLPKKPILRVNKAD